MQPTLLQDGRIVYQPTLFALRKDAVQSSVTPVSYTHLEGLGVSRLSLSTIGVFAVDGQIVLLQCDFTGGDGEVDGCLLYTSHVRRHDPCRPRRELFSLP